MNLWGKQKRDLHEVFYSCKQEPALTTFNTHTLFSVEVRSCPLWQTQMQCNFLQYTFSQFTFPEVNSIPLAEEQSEHRQIKAEKSDPDTLIQFPVTPVSHWLHQRVCLSNSLRTLLYYTLVCWNVPSFTSLPHDIYSQHCFPLCWAVYRKRILSDSKWQSESVAAHKERARWKGQNKRRWKLSRKRRSIQLDLSSWQ